MNGENKSRKLEKKDEESISEFLAYDDPNFANPRKELEEDVADLEVALSYNTNRKLWILLINFKLC